MCNIHHRIVFFMIVQRIFSIRHTDKKLTVVIAYMKLFQIADFLSALF